MGKKVFVKERDKMASVNSKIAVLTITYLHVPLAFRFEKCIAAQCYVLISVGKLYFPSQLQF